jgi:hypothetical protein
MSNERKRLEGDGYTDAELKAIMISRKLGDFRHSSKKRIGIF